MQDRRRRGERGDALDRAVDRVLARLVEGLPPGEAAALLERVRADLADLLIASPLAGAEAVEELASRVRIAIAFRVRFPRGE